MSNQLRLDVAQLTDVGRKREHNEDNMAYVIPKDQQVVAKKGALFIVADGMGGHAAGEVASEIAVDTVSNTYYQDDGNNVAASLLHAIRRANAAIHQRAAENMLRSGMGTTCVASVVRGNRAYVANVGDSRAYLVRGGQVKQISQDHSWVAEQVRAGLLTEDQARTHAQRNVITRCLGTQAEVEIDVFSEQVEEGDFLILCTDGLSGLVSDEEITRIVNSFVPQESVYHLVERANENGGPDNITAIVVRINEVGEPVEEAPLEEQTLPDHFSSRRTIRLGEREGWSGQELDADRFAATGGMSSVPTGFLPSSPGAVAVSSRNGNSSLRISSGSLVSPEGITAPQPAVAAAPMSSVAGMRPKKRSRLFYPTLAVLLLFVIALASGGAYYFLRTNENGTVDDTLHRSEQLIGHAKTEISTNDLTKGISDLATAQNMLRNLKNSQLSNTQSNEATLLLRSLTQEAKVAITNYNSSNSIAVLCTSTPQKTIDTGSTHTSALSLVSISKAKGAAPAINHTSAVSSLLFALGQDFQLYRLDDNNNQYSLVPIGTQKGAQITDITAANSQGGSRLLALVKQLDKTNTANYSVALFTADTSGKLSESDPVSIDSKYTNGWSSPMIAAWGSDVYVALSSNTSPYAAQVLHFTFDSRGQLSKTPTPIQISGGNIVSIAAFPYRLFLLLATGQVQSLPIGEQGINVNQTLPANVLVQQPIPSPLVGSGLTLSGGDYSSNINIPMVSPLTPKGNNPLMVAGAVSLASGTVNALPHLYIADSANHRILDLSLPAGNANTSSTATLSLQRQYASSNILRFINSNNNAVNAIAVDANGANVYALVQIQNPPTTSQNTSPSTDVVSMTTGQQTNCGP